MDQIDCNAGSATYAIRIVGGDVAYRCYAGTTVLQALSPVHHRRIQSGCHGGGCGVCRIRVVEGDYVTRCMSRLHVPVEDEAARITLACRTWPRSALIVEQLGKLPARLTRPSARPSQQDGPRGAANQEKTR